MSKRKGNKAGNVEQIDPRSWTIRSVILEACESMEALESLKDQIQILRGSVADHLLQVAKGIPACKDKDKELADTFLLACKVQEDWFKSDDAGQAKLDTIPRVFINIKSVIKAGYNLGLKMGDFETYNQLREKVTELRQKKAETNNDAIDDDSVIEAAEIDPRLGQSVNALLQTVLSVDDKDDKLVEDIIKQLNDTTMKIKGILKILLPVDPKKVEGVKEVKKTG